MLLFLVVNLHIISFTQNGLSLARRLRSLIETERAGAASPDDDSFFSAVTVSSASSAAQNPVSLSEWTKINFKTGNCLVFVGAAGIAVRAVAPFVASKTGDGAVVVIDEKGEFVVPILSGHIGKANETARKIAGLLGAEAVITTASDVSGLSAVDEFAAQNGLAVNDMRLAKDFAARTLDSARGDEARFTISPYIKKDILNLIPRSVILGIGCKKGISPSELEDFVLGTIENHNIDCRSLEKIASIDLKKDEQAILSLSEKLSLPFVIFSAEELNRIPQKVSRSDFVAEKTGTDNVCERAVFASGAERLLVPKTARDGMTLAVGIRKIGLEIPKDLQERLK